MEAVELKKHLRVSLKRRPRLFGLSNGSMIGRTIARSQTRCFGLSSIRLVQSRQGFWLLGGLLILTMGLLPVYLFPSGHPQLVDGPLVILVATYLLRRTEAATALRQNFMRLLPFIIWAVLVNIIYSFSFLLPEDNQPLIKSVELIYSYLIFLAFSYLFRDVLDRKKIGLLYWGFFLSFILLFTIPGYSEERISRSDFSFNNPNQLGYYALIMACLAGLLLQFKEKYGGGKVIYFWCDVVILLLVHVLMLLSLSRGAIVAVLILDLWILPRLTKKISILFLPLLALAILSLVWQPELIQERLTGRIDRLDMESHQVHEDLFQRIFYRLSIMNDVHYLVGRGGQSIPVQDTMAVIGEVHNIFGEIFRCYGLIGLMFFCFWLGKMVWNSRRLPGGLWIWAALLAYNMSHYGLRFRFLWILLAFINAMIFLQSRSLEDIAANGRRQPSRQFQIRPTF